MPSILLESLDRLVRAKAAVMGIDPAAVSRIRKRKWRRIVSWRERIVIDPKVLVGKPLIKGTRISVEFVVDLLARG